MKWAGFHRVALDAINITRDIRDRIAAPHVVELADSMRDVTGGEPGNVPWIVMGDNGKYDVKAGRDRMAALLLLNVDESWFRIIGEHTRVDLIKAEAHENLRRRHDDPVAIVAEMTRALEEARVVGTLSRKPGRPETAKGEARREVAKAAGVKVETLRKAEQRQKAREVAAAPDNQSPGETALPPPIETWGMPFSQAKCELVAPVMLALSAADRHLRAAQAALKDCGSMDGAVAARLYEDAHRLAANIRAAMPVALCPWCKGAQEVGVGYVTSCHGCWSFGWVTAEKLKVAPPELCAANVYAVATEFYDLAGAKAAWAKVSRQGSAVGRTAFRPGDSAKADPPPTPRGTKAKPRNTIVMPGGETFDPYAQEAPPASDADLPEPPDDDVPPMDDDEGLTF